MKIIILNGPPRSGKDTIGRMLGELGDDIYVTKFALPIKSMAHRLLGLNDAHYDSYDDVKDKPNEDFYGITPREFYVALSQLLMKPLYGEGFFGRLLVRDIIREAEEREAAGRKLNYVVITDGGFKPEVRELADEFGAHTMLLCHIYRPNTNFIGDSRRYIRYGGIRKIDIGNGKGIAQLRQSVTETLGRVSDFEDLAARMRSKSKCS